MKILNFDSIIIVQIFVSIFFSIVFFQSGIDKIIDRARRKTDNFGNRKKLNKPDLSRITKAINEDGDDKDFLVNLK